MRVWIDRLRSFGQVPVPDGARGRLAMVVAAAFVAVAAAIAALSPSIPQPPITPAPPPVEQAPAPAASPAAAAARRTSATLTKGDVRAAKRVARQFLDGGYLAYDAARSPKRIAATTPALRSALADMRPRVPPAQRRSPARIKQLMPVGNPQHGDVAILATLVDGQTTFTLTLRAQRQGRRWLVTDIAP